MRTSQDNPLENEIVFVPFTLCVKKLGFNIGTARNWLSQGKFPLPIHPINGLNFVKQSDLTIFKNNPSAKFESSFNSNLLDSPRRGRPPNRQKIKVQLNNQNS